MVLENKRIIAFDFIRLFAIILVVLTHAVEQK